MLTEKDLINELERKISDPHQGLTEDLFLFVSRITPLVNVDLLIRNERRQTLLTWRDDSFFPKGWHIPGGIIRYKETREERITLVARSELETEVEFDPVPVAVNEFILKERKTRGHFISFLYECRLKADPPEKLKYRSDIPKNGQYAWFDGPPDDLLDVHRVYKNYFY